MIFSNFASAKHFLMQQKTNAIVLHVTKYGDQKCIVDFLSEEFGRIAAVIKIPASSRGKMKKQLFQPLTMLSLELDYRMQKPFQQIHDAQLLRPWQTLNSDPVKISVSLLLNEILWHSTQQEQADRRMFHFIVNSLECLDLTTRSVANFHIAFLIQFSHYLGIMLTADDYRHGMLFDMQQAMFTSTLPTHRYFLRAEETAYVPTLLRIRYHNMHLFRMTREQRNYCLDSIITYYRLHVPSMPELRSLAVLHEIFA